MIFLNVCDNCRYLFKTKGHPWTLGMQILAGTPLRFDATTRRHPCAFKPQLNFQLFFFQRIPILGRRSERRRMTRWGRCVIEVRGKYTISNLMAKADEFTPYREPKSEGLGQTNQSTICGVVSYIFSIITKRFNNTKYRFA